MALNVISFNICSVPKHLDEFITTCIHNDSSPDAICLSETKITNAIDNLYKLEGYYKLTLNNTRDSGGLAIFVKTHHKILIRSDLKVQELLETLFIEIQQPSGNIIVGVIYRRPKTNIKLFFEKLKPIITIVSSENKKCYLTGDFNINLLNKNDMDVIHLTCLP